MGKRILLYDKLHNGKGWDDLIMRVNKMEYLKFNKADGNYDLCIFCYNECSLFGPINFNKLLAIRNQILKQSPKCVIINDPIFYKIFSSKLELYNAIITNRVGINIAKTFKGTPTMYPCIIANPVQAGGNERYLCQGPNDLPKDMNKYICIEYIESKLFDNYFTCKVYAINNKIIYYLPRFSTIWNVSITNQIFNKSLQEKAHQYIHAHYAELEKIVYQLSKLFHNCVYAADLIVNNNNKWYVCEVGFKFTPNIYLRQIANQDIPGKITRQQFCKVVREEILGLIQASRHQYQLQ